MPPNDPMSVDWTGFNQTNTNQLGPAVPGSGTSGGLGGWLSGSFGDLGLGDLTSKDLQLGLGGLRTLGGLWQGFQQMGLARDQLNFAKNFANRNLANQVQTLNTRLEDRARSRGVAEGQTQGQVDDYISRNRLSS